MMRNWINLTESNTMFDTAQFPILMANLNERRQGQMKTVVGYINAGMSAGEIANVHFKDAKDVYNRALEEAWRVIADKGGADAYSSWRDDTLDKKTKDFLNGFHYPRADLVAGQLKKSLLSPVASTNPTLVKLIPFLKEAEAFSVALVSLKDKIVKRVIKTDDEKRQERFVPPPAKSAAAQMTIAALQEVANKSYEQLKKNLIASYQAAGVRFAEQVQKTLENPELLPSANRWSERKAQYLVPSHVLSGGELFAVQKATDTVGNGYGEKFHYVLKNDAMAILEAAAINDATEMRDEFVVKNAKKLAPIVDQKPNIDTVKEVGHTVSVNGFTGTIDFKFQDGSQFTVQNSVVYNVSKHGTQFLQFPLRFSNVVLANGERMKGPSEKNMNEIFAKQ